MNQHGNPNVLAQARFCVYVYAMSTNPGHTSDSPYGLPGHFAGVTQRHEREDSKGHGHQQLEEKGSCRGHLQSRALNIIALVGSLMDCIRA